MEKSIYTPEYALLCAELVRIRREANHTQRDLASLLKVPHSWVAKVESAERRVDLIEMSAFVSACGHDPAVFCARLLSQIAQVQETRRRKGKRPR